MQSLVNIAGKLTGMSTTITDHARSVAASLYNIRVQLTIVKRWICNSYVVQHHYNIRHNYTGPYNSTNFLKFTIDTQVQMSNLS